MTEAMILSCRRDFLIGVNHTNIIFEAYTPVGIGNASRAALPTETLLRIPLELHAASTAYPAWGICRENILPGKCGEVQIIGITPCRVSGREVKPYADILNSGLSYSDSGWKLIFPSSDDNNSLPLILLGSSRVENYSGYFKVEYGNPGTYRCVNGSDPESNVAGLSDLGDLAAGSIAPDNSGVFWLYATFSRSTGRYTLTLNRPSGNNFGRHQLAHLDGSGRIVQDHVSGYIHWSAFYAV